MCRLVCLSMDQRGWSRPRHEYKRAALAATRRHGALNVAGREASWRQDHPCIGTALAKITWIDIRRITGATGWGEQILYRLKLQAFRWWDSTRKTPGCPIEECLQCSVNTAHTFWLCVGATRLWSIFYAPWAALGLIDSPSRLSATFSLELEFVPPGVWTLLEALHHQDPDAARDAIRSHVYDILAQCWRLGVVTTLQVIWKRRCWYKDPREDTSVARAAAILHGRLRAAYLTVQAHARIAATQPRQIAAARVCYCALTQPSPETADLPQPTRSVLQHLLYFDGGSRGNPGPGGSGSVLVRLGGRPSTPTIIWMPSVSYASRTTNNLAEYHGLLDRSVSAMLYDKDSVDSMWWATAISS